MHRTGARAILNTPSGSIELAILSPSDFLALGRQCRQERKADLVDNARSAGTAPDTILKLLNEFDSRPWRHADTIGYLNTAAGAAAAVLRALRKDRPRAKLSDLDKLGISPGRMLEAAAAVCRLRLIESRPRAEDHADPFARGGATTTTSRPPPKIVTSSTASRSNPPAVSPPKPPVVSPSNPSIATGDSRPM